MKISFRNILRHILAGLCAVVFVVAAYVGGYFITFGDSSAFLAVFIACAAALAVWLIANIAVAAGQNKKYGGMNARQVYDYSVKVQRETEEDYARAERGVLYSLLAVRLSAAGLLALLLIACLAAGAGAAYDYLNTVPGIVAALISYGVFAALFAPLAASGSDRASLGAKDYPLIFQTVERAAQKTGCKRPYTVCLGMGPTGISEGNGRIYLELNAIECAMLTSEELYSVMLHEFAHAVNADTGRTGRLSRASSLGRRQCRVHGLSVCGDTVVHAQEHDVRSCRHAPSRTARRRYGKGRRRGAALHRRHRQGNHVCPLSGNARPRT